MKLEFFDVNVFMGRPTRAVFGPAVDGAALIDALAAAGIGRALPWHIAQYDYAQVEGNRLLGEAIAAADNLVGCWALLPPVTNELPFGGEGFFAEMRRRRIAALRIFPEQGRFPMDRVSFGPFLDEVSERRIPILLSPDRGAPWPSIAALLKDYPRLTCVLCDVGEWGMSRWTWPLLAAYESVYIETSRLSFQAGGVESTVQRFGAERVLFGSAFPLRYFEAAMLQLTHADLSDAEKVSIASGNLQRLVQRVAL